MIMAKNANFTFPSIIHLCSLSNFFWVAYLLCLAYNNLNKYLSNECVRPIDTLWQIHLVDSAVLCPPVWETYPKHTKCRGHSGGRFWAGGITSKAALSCLELSFTKTQPTRDFRGVLELLLSSFGFSFQPPASPSTFFSSYIYEVPTIFQKREMKKINRQLYNPTWKVKLEVK